MTDFVAIVLAAGQGKRMKSALPKVLHPLAGRPMVSYPVAAALEAGASRVVVVVGHGGDAVERALREQFDDRVQSAVQAEQRGTGDAARVGFEAVAEHEGWVLIVNGDAPLLTAQTLRVLIDASTAANKPLGLVTAMLPDATGYGRILRNAQGGVVGVREERDCSDSERALREFNPAVYAIQAGFLRAALGRLGTDNAQGELYLTDLVEMAAAEGGVVDVVREADELHGVNDRLELAAREQLLVRRIVDAHARAGVGFRALDSVHVDADVQIEPDAMIERDVQLRGRTWIGAGAHVDVGCVLTDVEVGAGATLLPYSVGTESTIGAGARVGPFAHLRPRSALGPQVHIGNFVETKNTRIGAGSKANHLAYLGDGEIGEGVNVGAGTIFCNYDGFGKYVTVLEDGAFIGSDSQLVAPVRVGKGGYVATGTTVTLDVPSGALAVGRARQVNKDDYAERIRASLRARAAAARKKH
jgi:bifunctional UDP-N-acetylglucosamine pyrophosphorylase/glucosamine-1-phosphate N-acetyltransferase